MLIHGAELAFNEAKHAYTWDGKFVPGVTTILSCINKPALVAWAANMASDFVLGEIPLRSVKVQDDAGTCYSIKATDLATLCKDAKGAHRRKSKEAADIGTNVHQYAENYFKKQPLPAILTDQAKRGIEAFHKWYDAHDIQILASERRVFSKKWFYAGTCDFVAKIDGVMCVGDIKTSSGIYPEMRFQTAAYQQAIEEEKDIQFPVRWIVRFDKKTGEFEAKPFHDFVTDFQGFHAALTLHRTLQSIEQEQSNGH